MWFGTRPWILPNRIEVKPSTLRHVRWNTCGTARALQWELDHANRGSSGEAFLRVLWIESPAIDYSTKQITKGLQNQILGDFMASINAVFACAAFAAVSNLWVVLFYYQLDSRRDTGCTLLMPKPNIEYEIAIPISQALPRTREISAQTGGGDNPKNKPRRRAKGQPQHKSGEQQSSDLTRLSWLARLRNELMFFVCRHNREWRSGFEAECASCAHQPNTNVVTSHGVFEMA